MSAPGRQTTTRCAIWPDQRLRDFMARSTSRLPSRSLMVSRLSCSAAVLEGTDVVYVLRVHTHKIMRTSLGVGSRLPAYCTALGRVLLAGLDDADLRQRLQASKVQKNTEHTETDIDQLLARIGQVRRQGWSLVNQELEEGLISVAAPIVGRSGRVVAAINISGQVNRTDVQAMEQRYLPALLQRARAISARMV